MGLRRPLSFDTDGGRWIGEHRPELIDLSQLLGGLVSLVASARSGPPSVDAWRNALADRGDLVRMLGPRAAHVRVRGAPIEDVVVKVIAERRRGGVRSWADRLLRSRAHRAYLWGHRIRAHGIETPRPLGFLERAQAPALENSFVVTEYIPAPSLTEWRDRRLAAPAHTPEAVLEKRALIRRVAELTRELHARGFLHGDLHAGNVLVTDRAAMVIDLEGVRTIGAALPRARLRNLVRLNRDFLDTRALTRTDRMRFLATYLRHQPAADRDQHRRTLFAEVAEGTKLKLQERGEAFQ